MITLNFYVDGKLFGLIEVSENLWHLSEYKTYEQAYIAGHLTQPNKAGYSYNLWLERPLAEEKK